jgi:predicted adenine nucleotide alpha hydrolase (AANH) superfamily ATPase
VYDHDAWLAHIAGFEDEPEKGERCVKCFEFNLGRTAIYARHHGFDFFTTTLSISPHKHSRTIFDIGTRLGNFLSVDFKKKDGFRHSIELSKQYELYRQNYCGCEFSLREQQERNGN